MTILIRSLRACALWVLLAAVLFLVAEVQAFERFAKILSNAFIVGRSSVKVYLFIAFLFLLWGIFHSKRVLKKDPLPSHAFLTAALYLIGIVEFFLFYEAIYGSDFRFLGYVFHVYDPPYSESYTTLFHIHNSKAIFSFFISWVSGSKEFYFFDPGAPFLELCPKGLIVLQAVLYVLYLWISLRMLFYAKGKMSIGDYFGFGLALLVILKNLTDGGLFTGESWLFGVPMYLFFLSVGKFVPGGESSKRCIFFLIVSLIFFGTWQFFFRFDAPDSSPENDLVSPLMRYALAFAIMSGATLLDRGIRKSWDLKAFLGLCCGALSFCFLFYVTPVNRSKNFYNLENMPLFRDKEIVAAGWDPKVFESLLAKGEITVISESVIEKYRRVRMWLNKDTSYYELSRRLGTNPNLGPITVIGASCIADNKLHFEERCLVEPLLEKRELLLPEGFRIEASSPMGKRTLKGRDFYWQDISMTLPGCTPMLLTARLNLMRAFGIQKAICARHPLSLVKISEQPGLAGEIE